MTTFISPDFANGSALDLAVKTALGLAQTSYRPGGKIDQLLMQSDGIEFTHRITFADTGDLFAHPTVNKDAAQDAYRRAFYDEALPGVFEIVSDVSRYGEHCVKCTAGDGGSTGRAHIYPAGFSRNGINRGLPANTRHLVGFSFLLDGDSLVFDPGNQSPNWELYFQVLNARPPAVGYGPTNNPFIAIERASSTTCKLVSRFNKNDGTTDTVESEPFPISVGEWNDVIVEFVINNKGGWCKVYLDHALVAEYNGPLGHVYGTITDYNFPAFGVYHSPPHTGRHVYIDQISVTADRVASVYNVAHEFLSWDGLSTNFIGKRAVNLDYSITLSFSLCNNALMLANVTSPRTLTIPTVTSASIPIGAEFSLIQTNTGPFEIEASDGVTFIPPGPHLVDNIGDFIRGVYVGDDIWVIVKTPS